MDFTPIALRSWLAEFFGFQNQIDYARSSFDPSLARVVKSVDTQDLKSWEGYPSCQFKSGLEHSRKFFLLKSFRIPPDDL